MPCDITLLERGALCLALYPYSQGVPLDRVLREVEDDFTVRLARHESVESIARVIRDGPPPEIVVTMKLRPVLLLQDGTSTSRQDVMTARVMSITDKKRAKGNWYKRLQSRTHPAHYLIGDMVEHGMEVESYVDLLSIGNVNKALILRRVGVLDDVEMRAVSELVLRTTELDLSEYLAKYHARMLRNAERETAGDAE